MNFHNGLRFDINLHRRVTKTRSQRRKRSGLDLAVYRKLRERIVAAIMSARLFAVTGRIRISQQFPRHFHKRCRFEPLNKGSLTRGQQRRSLSTQTIRRSQPVCKCTWRMQPMRQELGIRFFLLPLGARARCYVSSARSAKKRVQLRPYYRHYAH